MVTLWPHRGIATIRPASSASAGIASPTSPVAKWHAGWFGPIGKRRTFILDRVEPLRMGDGGRGSTERRGFRRPDDHEGDERVAAGRQLASSFLVRRSRPAARGVPGDDI